MLYTGKTVEEALLIAEAETGRNRDSFIYTVSEKKNGFFGAKEIVIEVQGFKQNAKLEIKNGMIVYHSGDINPSIAPGDNVIVKVNNNMILSKTYIKYDDSVIIEPLNSYSNKTINIEVSDDKLYAYLEIIYIPRREFIIMDMDPAHEIIVQAKCINESYPEPYSKKDIEELLNLNKITYGIKWDNIPSILKGGKHCIAQGLTQKNPVDDKIKYLFNNKPEKKPVETNGKVDYLSIGTIDSVEAGTVIAIREEGEDGKPGYDVYGAIMQSAKKKTNKFKKGPGSEILDNGNRVIASIKGMVSVKNDTICVFPIHDISGDVDIKTGNIQFDGDVVVRGNVKEGFKINAGNDVTIYGNVAEANISSGGNLKIERNVISSILKAGDKQINDLRTMQYIKTYGDFINDIINAYYELNKLGKISPGVNIGAIFKVLLQSKYKPFKDQIIEGIGFIAKNHIREDMKALWDDGIKLFRLIEDGDLTDIKYAITINHLYTEFISKHDFISTPADVIINYSQNSSIFATNNVEVRGKGCYNTSIIAQNKVIFTGFPGVIRGGQISGAKGITAKEVGSSAGVRSYLKTSKEGLIEASVVYQNTILCFGEQSYRIDNPVKTLKAYMDKGEIMVEKLKL
jgi:uncharacterized protein (DUF342 family)